MSLSQICDSHIHLTNATKFPSLETADRSGETQFQVAANLN